MKPSGEETRPIAAVTAGHSSAFTFCTTEVGWGTDTERATGTVSCWKSSWGAVRLAQPSCAFCSVSDCSTILHLVCSLFFYDLWGVQRKCQSFCILEENCVTLPVSQCSKLPHAGNQSTLLLSHSCWVRLGFHVSLQEQHMISHWYNFHCE